MAHTITPDQWEAVKQVNLLMKAAQARGDLDDTWDDFTNHLTRLLAASTHCDPTPFEVTEHWLHLLSHFINNAPDDPTQIAAGSLRALEWAADTLAAAAEFGLSPVENSTKSIWLLICGEDA